MRRKLGAIVGITAVLFIQANGAGAADSDAPVPVIPLRGSEAAPAEGAETTPAPAPSVSDAPAPVAVPANPETADATVTPAPALPAQDGPTAPAAVPTPSKSSRVSVEPVIPAADSAEVAMLIAVLGAGLLIAFAVVGIVVGRRSDPAPRPVAAATRRDLAA